VVLEEFMSKMKILFPGGEWKKFTLETNVEIRWNNPIHIDRWPYTDPWRWSTPIYGTGTIGGDTGDSIWIGSGSNSLTSGVYCIEA